MSNKIFMGSVYAQFFKPFVVLIAILFLSLSSTANAAEITYTGKAGALQNLPAWLNASPSSFFPGTAGTPLSSGNKVTINYTPSAAQAANPEFVCGGLSESKQTANNSVVLRNGKVVKNIFGGLSLNGNAKGNSVTINGGSVGGGVVGGWSEEGNATNNTVTINKATIGNDAFGGWSEDGIAEGNRIIISGGSISGNVSGGMSLTGSGVANNTVTISGGAVDGEVSGGKSHAGDAVNNTITISGGSVNGKVIGGYGLYGNATGNTITISGGLVNGDIIGGLGELHATNNTITITGNPSLVKANILGGFKGRQAGNAFTGNTLNFKSSGISATDVSNFEHYKFYLPENVKSGNVMLTVKETANLAGTTVTIFLKDSAKMSKADKIALIHSNKGVSGSPKNKSCTVQHGGLLYDFSIYTDNNNLWAKVIKVSSGTK